MELFRCKKGASNCLKILLIILLGVVIDRCHGYYVATNFDCKEKEYFELELSAKLSRKYIDAENHAYQTLVFCDSTKIQWLLEVSPFYDYLQANDYVEKDSGTMEVKVRRAGFDTSFTLMIAKPIEVHEVE